MAGWHQWTSGQPRSRQAMARRLCRALSGYGQRRLYARAKAVGAKPRPRPIPRRFHAWRTRVGRRANPTGDTGLVLGTGGFQIAAAADRRDDGARGYANVVVCREFGTGRTIGSNNVTITPSPGTGGSGCETHRMRREIMSLSRRPARLAQSIEAYRVGGKSRSGMLTGLAG